MTEIDALSKANRINLLFDFYERLLTDKQQTYLRYYFHDDYSLGEIASLFDISRQAVYEHIKRAETVLEEYEIKLRLLEKHQIRNDCFERLERELTYTDEAPTILTGRLLPIIAELREVD